MTARTYTRMACDYCGGYEERETAEAWMPAAWKYAKVGYFDADQNFVPESSALLCEVCACEVIVRIRPAVKA